MVSTHATRDIRNMYIIVAAFGKLLVGNLLGKCFTNLTLKRFFFFLNYAKDCVVITLYNITTPRRYKNFQTGALTSVPE